MNIFFDVDYTLVDWDGSLRPHVRETFQRLVDEGHSVFLWSGVGLRWEVVERHGLRDLVSDCFVKPLQNHEEERKRLGVPFRPDFVIDDHSEVVTAFGGYVIRPYYSYGNPNDTEMLRVYDAIARFHAHRNGA
ncbi:MAG: hypothetical protein HYY02_03480 [Chloroflexi bacterium]|nr:hypothetical protein [Chloroflexota bacterium]